MKGLPISSLTIGVCLLALSAGVAFADNLHNGPINEDWDLDHGTDRYRFAHASFRL